MGKYDDRPYRVGKCKPPPEHKWPKGKSGNPAGGRKKRKRTKRADLRELLQFAGAKKIVADTERGAVSITMIDAFIEQLYIDILEGTAAHRLKALVLLERLGVFNVPTETFELSDDHIAEVVECLAEEYRLEQAREAEWTAGTAAEQRLTGL